MSLDHFCFTTSDAEEYQATEAFAGEAVVNTRRSKNAVSLVTVISPRWICGAEQSVEKTVFLSDLGHPALQLTTPLPVTVQSAAESVAAYAYDLDELGVGESEAAALEDLRSSLIAGYYLLKDEVARLGPLQQRHWAFFRRIIREV